MENVQKWSRTVFGIFLLLVGGLLSLPGVFGPGLLIVFLGLIILAHDYPWAKRRVEQLKKRFRRK